MLSARWLLSIGGVVCLLGSAHANPVPSTVIGSWSTEPGCPATGMRVIFSVNSITVVQGNGHRGSAEIETSGNVDDRLEIRVIKPPTGAAAGGGLKLGDGVVVRRENDDLRVLSEVSGGLPHEPTNQETLHRCSS